MEKKNNDKISISRKVTLIFIAVIIIEALVFLISLAFTMRTLKEDTTFSIIDTRISYTSEIAKTNGMMFASSLVVNNQDTVAAYYFVDNTGKHFIFEEAFLEYIDEEELRILITSVTEDKRSSFEYLGGTIYYKAVYVDDAGIILVGSNGSSMNRSLYRSILYITIFFISILAIGSLVVISTINSIVRRVNRLCSFVESMPHNNYRDSYIDDGDDEIETLSKKIDEMRITITQDEQNRDLMLQNISHDLKTPIAVIKSYAEAIADGIEDIEKTEIIISQSEKLEKKVKNLIEFNKLSHLRHQGEFEEVYMKPIIEEVVLNCKYIANIEFNVDADDSIFIGKFENYFTVVENIVENSLRYARKAITITLKDNVLKISNDGEPISEDFIKHGFRPYEKGHQGKFGLGMSIVARTLEYFNMNLEVQNEPNNKGVTFMIYPK